MNDVVHMTEREQNQHKEEYASSKIFNLQRPVTVHGSSGPEKLSKITLRTPSGEDLFELDLPYRTVAVPTPPDAPKGSRGGFEMKMNGSALREWIERLSDGKLTKGEIGKLTARDVRSMYEWICSETNPMGEEDAAGN